jgi:hypothetical protein
MSITLGDGAGVTRTVDDAFTMIRRAAHRAGLPDPLTDPVIDRLTGMCDRAGYPVTVRVALDGDAPQPLVITVNGEHVLHRVRAVASGPRSEPVIDMTRGGSSGRPP